MAEIKAKTWSCFSRPRDYDSESQSFDPKIPSDLRLRQLFLINNIFSALAARGRGSNWGIEVLQTFASPRFLELRCLSADDSKSLSIEGAWVPHWCAAGQGMVNFAGFFAIIKANRFSGPVQLHFEYPGLGGAENGNRKLRIAKGELIAAMRRDLSYVRNVMSAQQLI